MSHSRQSLFGHYGVKCLMWSYPYFLALSILQGMKQICNTYLDSDWKRMSQKCYQFVINEKKNLIFSPAFYPIMCFMKSPKNLEKMAILKTWQLVFFWGVTIHIGEKYAWFVIEILIHVSKKIVFWICYGTKE